MGWCRGMRRIMKLLMSRLDLDHVDIGSFFLVFLVDHGLRVVARVWRIAPFKIKELVFQALVFCGVCLKLNPTSFMVPVA